MYVSDDVLSLLRPFYINSPVLHLFLFFFPSSCAAGHDVRREAMGVFAVDMQRSNKNAIIQSSQTKPNQPSIVLPPTWRPQILATGDTE